ncbi:DUF4097 family beta strand repeat-containing protein [Ferrimonas sp. SCSIO 43195]|uniref:DUF4097 family beta strand repeat-containing protein n=1 Tax=Ferrimonas sp. SCSIO 43195 TaxID=2822844 RepID=UPI0020761E62|nr:DUF4097 family beta strand repeat-containing protein [Ferrimonas sp. SCSIO 43195]USD38354.1 DUF4097 family beta strand repeat protein [Ferrimonas sp. SCSIO 43195]
MKHIILGATLFATSVSALAGEAIDSRMDADGIRTLNLIVPRGDVTLTGGDHNQISIRGELDDQAERWVFERDGDTLVAEVKMPRNWRGNNDGSRLTVTLPSSIRFKGEGVSTDFNLANLQRGLKINNVSGDISLERIQGEIDVEVVSGDIKAHELSGEIELETVSGDIDASGHQGSGSYESVSGNVTLARGGHEVEVENVSGDIQLSLDRVRELDVTSVSGDIQVTVAALDTGAELEFETVNGDTSLALPGDASVRVRLETGPGGDISNSLTQDQPNRGKHVATEKLHFDHNGGNAKVEMQTVNGSLSLSPLSLK